VACRRGLRRSAGPHDTRSSIRLRLAGHRHASARPTTSSRTASSSCTGKTYQAYARGRDRGLVPGRIAWRSPPLQQRPLTRIPLKTRHEGPVIRGTSVIGVTDSCRRRPRIAARGGIELEKWSFADTRSPRSSTVGRSQPSTSPTVLWACTWWRSSATLDHADDEVAAHVKSPMKLYMKQ